MGQRHLFQHPDNSDSFLPDAERLNLTEVKRQFWTSLEHF
jgi:hypothetical protein